jgi:hypothetical protein
MTTFRLKIGKITSDKKKFHIKYLQKLNYLIVLRFLNLEGKRWIRQPDTWRKYKNTKLWSEIIRGRKEGREGML